MRNYLDTLLNLHPTQEEQDEAWDTPETDAIDVFWGMVGFLAAGLVILAVIA